MRYFYNYKPHDGCWIFKSAKLIMRKEVHINDVPPWNHKPKLLPSCYRKSKYVYVGPDQTY